MHDLWSDPTGREGMVFNIQKYSIHDGPGIRTTVFLKGCPLRCEWCANPESINPYPEIFFREEKCERCERCIGACPLKAIQMSEGGAQIDRTKCNLCMKCVEVCPTGAISQIGKKMTLEEIVKEVVQDEIFYRNSGGGITASGGEPLYQAKFTLNLLRECKNRGLHTALDTTGHAKWEVLDEISNYTDLVLFDIKHLDSEIHQKGTGVGNELILKNLDKILKKGVTVWARIPIIPNFNNSPQYIETLAKFLSKKPFQKISILNYHEWGKHKYKLLGREYPLKETHPLSEEELKDIKNIIESHGLEVTINY
ncbi:MAG: glycyl-radical enzyme activating protein [Candidatus Freyarchaeota archaeon]|nr:glycyl-radical enzyme activating protein [Candidatus Jordarchaeia archaeon]MBS7269527.1 glycyl-radical enzyme activating protein [Candidatus Jordarchaeia archaeon]MBS7280252.1 glycyl-radical enzyme activating protein [Candidatus Jordarchaeia archaeon]